MRRRKHILNVVLMRAWRSKLHLWTFANFMVPFCFWKSLLRRQFEYGFDFWTFEHCFTRTMIMFQGKEWDLVLVCEIPFRYGIESLMSSKCIFWIHMSPSVEYFLALQVPTSLFSFCYLIFCNNALVISS